jgi:hypothetical protein
MRVLIALYDFSNPVVRVAKALDLFLCSSDMVNAGNMRTPSAKDLSPASMQSGSVAGFVFYLFFALSRETGFIP